MVIPWESNINPFSLNKEVRIMIGIYKITNKISGKTYIGQSNDIERRFSEHKYKKDIPVELAI